MNHVGQTMLPRDWSGSDPERLSALLLRLYDAANCEDVTRFQDRAMAILSEVIAFSGSWWGSGVGPASGHRVHGSHLHNLPVDLTKLYNATSSDNPMARVSASHPNRAFRFAADIMYSEPAVAALSEYMGACESLCITQTDPRHPDRLRFLVVTRGADTSPFRDDDKRWLEWLNPHLNAALDLCCSVQMARWRRVHDYSVLLAISDAKGFLHLSEPGLFALLVAEWPGWTGTQLPDILVAELARGSSAFSGRTIVIGFRWLGGAGSALAPCETCLRRTVPPGAGNLAGVCVRAVVQGRSAHRRHRSSNGAPSFAISLCKARNFGQGRSSTIGEVSAVFGGTNCRMKNAASVPSLRLAL